MPGFLLIPRIEMPLLQLCRLALLLLNLVHELLDARLEALLELLLGLGVLLQSICRLGDGDLERAAAILALADECLVVGDILLEVIEDLQFLIERDQSVQLVLQFVFLLLEQELQVGVVRLVQHRLSHAWGLLGAPGRARRWGLVDGRGSSLLLQASWARLLLFCGFLHR